jgi:predicted nucleic acid-binding Zn ribbon protein
MGETFFGRAREILWIKAVGRRRQNSHRVAVGEVGRLPARRLAVSEPADSRFETAPAGQNLTILLNCKLLK